MSLDLLPSLFKFLVASDRQVPKCSNTRGVKLRLDVLPGKLLFSYLIIFLSFLLVAANLRLKLPDLKYLGEMISMATLRS